MTKLHRADGKHNTRYGANVEREIEAARRAMTRAVDAFLDGSDSSFGDREAAMLELGNEVGRRYLEADLQQLADQYGDERLRIDGVPYKRHSVGTVTYHSLYGPMSIERHLYRRQLERNGGTAVPLELAAGLVERGTPALAYRIALGYAQGPSRHCIEQLQASARRPPSRSTLERMAKRIGTQIKAQSAAIEPLVRGDERLPKGARAISVGLDRTTVPMQELLHLPDWVSATHTPRRTRPYVRSKPAPVEVKYRMAYVGTVCFVDQDRRSIKTLRYVASADAGPASILKSMMDDVLHANLERSKSRRARLPVGIVQDGAPEMWTLVGDALRKAGLGNTCHETLDWYHLFEHLADMLSLLPMQKVDREATLRRWKKQFRADDLTARRVLNHALRKTRSYTQDCHAAYRHSNVESAKQLRAHVVYLKNNQHRMNYAETLRQGLPVGSGATEGACRSTISVRAKGCGQRWKPTGVDAALTLRAYHISERLPQVWNGLANQYRGEILRAA